MENKEKISFKGKTLLAVLPDTFTGSEQDWKDKLVERGLWDGRGRYQEIEIPLNDWFEMLDECEATPVMRAVRKVA